MKFWRTPLGVQRHYINGRYGQIHYRIAAPAHPSAVPLLCFHLSPNSGRVYAQFIAQIGHDRIAIAPDTPGFGLSDAPTTAPEISDYAACMGEFADAHGFKKFDVMGYHTGSKIALALAQQRPAQLRRLVLVSAPIYTEAELVQQYKSMGTSEVEKLSEDGSHLLRLWQDHWRWKDSAAPASFIQREVAEGLVAGEQAWWGHQAAFKVQHALELPKVEQPILLLCPKDDLWEATQRARPFLRNGKFVELPNYAHGFLDVHTTEVVDIVRHFLDASEQTF